MRLKVGVIALGSFVALAAFGCGDDGRSSATDAGMMIFLDGAMPDAPVNDTDAGPGTDAGPRRDAGPTECTVATACEPTRGCPGVGESCIAAVATEIGGEDDPIRREDADGGIQPAVPITYWRGGYCTPGAPTLVTSEGACDPNAAAGEDGCGSCAECISLGEQDGVGIVMCVRSCEPSVTENPCPQMGQACNFGSNVCFPGCSSDDECRVFRPDSNGDGVITDFDPTNGSGTVDGGTAMVDPDCFGGEPPIGCGDLLMYDGESDAVCNTVTSRCEHGTTGTEPGMSATAGDTCTKDSECEPNGDCLSAAATEDGWPGGYCIKFGCMLPGRECAGDAVCQERRVGVDLCLAGCEVAAEDDEANADELRLGLAGHNPDCREGYSCVWDGIGAEGVANNGACLPGNYNEVTEANVGTTCTEETSCYSPYGQGVCLNNEFWGDGYCTMFDCNAPGMPTDVCGAGAQCATFVEDVAACFQNCTSADECNDGLGCYDTTMLGITVSAGTKICFPGCLAAADCRTGETCNRPDPMGLGDCVATP